MAVACAGQKAYYAYNNNDIIASLVLARTPNNG